MSFKAVLFDLDGVIVDSMPLHADSWITILSEYGMELTRYEIFQREGMSGIASIIDIFKERGLPVPGGKELERLLEKKLSLFENHRVDLFPGVIELLGLIKKHALPMALVTGSLRRTVEYELDDTLRSFFDAIITIEDVEKGKPDPDPYLKAARALKVAPEISIAVENAPLGIVSARRAGAYCAAVETTLPREHLAAADIVFGNHDELRGYFSKLFEGA